MSIDAMALTGLAAGFFAVVLFVAKLAGGIKMKWTPVIFILLLSTGLAWLLLHIAAEAWASV